MSQKKDRVVIDTNIWISYLINGNYPSLDTLLFENRITLIFSEELINEFISVCDRPKFKRYFQKNETLTLLKTLISLSEIIEVSSKFDLVRDKKDNFLINLISDGNATHLITGDKDLLEIGVFENCKIMTLRAYLKSRLK